MEGAIVATSRPRAARGMHGMQPLHVDDILPGLLAPQKFLKSKYFYDQRGSKLFELITKTTEYYVTRAEKEIFATHADEISQAVARGCMLIEPGAGNCEKVETLLPALMPSLYIPVDISEAHLLQAVRRLTGRFPWLQCMPVATDFEHLDDLPVALSPTRRVIFFPGSTIGNFYPEEAIDFLRGLRGLIDIEGGLLIGVDLEKEKHLLENAYNDEAGVTGLFNLNILNNVNRLTGSDFRIGNFEHYAFYNETEKRIEMHLRCLRDHVVVMGGQDIQFERGELLHTENSYKYSTASFSALAAEAGFTRSNTWHDRHGLFALHYFVPG